MKKVLSLLLLTLLIFTLFMGTAQAAPTKDNVVNVTVVNSQTGKPFTSEDVVSVYLYKPDTVQGRNYNEVYTANEKGQVTFTRVPSQELILLVMIADYYTTPEGYHLMNQLPMWYTTINFTGGEQNITVQY